MKKFLLATLTVASLSLNASAAGFTYFCRSQGAFSNIQTKEHSSGAISFQWSGGPHAFNNALGRVDGHGNHIIQVESQNITLTVSPHCPMGPGFPNPSIIPRPPLPHCKAVITANEVNQKADCIPQEE